MTRFNVSCWCVEHGEATILWFNLCEAQIVDFGTNPPITKRTQRAVKEARDLLSRWHNDISAVITHLHYDHYSLVPHILDLKCLKALYLPAIPKPQRIVKVVSYLIAYEIVTLLRSGKMVLDELSKKIRALYLVYRGKRIELGKGFYARVLWPPPELPSSIAEEVMRKLEPVYEIVKKLVKEQGLREVEEKAEEIERILSVSEARRYEEKEPEPIKVEDLLPLPTLRGESLEKGDNSSTRLPCSETILTKIRDAINDLSLVLKYYCSYNRGSYALALIPGDNSDQILDHLSMLEQGEKPCDKRVLFLRAAHHGTHYGKYIEEHSALLTWISWTKRSSPSMPHPGYLLISEFPCIAEHIEHISMYLYPLLNPWSVHIYMRLKGQRTPRSLILHAKYP